MTAPLQPLAMLSRLTEIQERLQGEDLFPRFEGRLGPFNILLAAPQRKLAEHFQAAMQASFGPLLAASRIRFLRALELFEDLPRDGVEIHSLWILFPADRYEPGGDLFQEWADRHRRALARPSLFAFRLFPAPLLETWAEPILQDDPEKLAGRRVPVLCCPLDMEKPSWGADDRARPALDLLEKLLLALLTGRDGPWEDLTGGWDREIAATLDRRIAALRAPRQVTSPAGRSLLQARELFRLHAAAREASHAVESAMILAQELDRVAARAEIEEQARTLAADLNGIRLARYGGWRTGGGVQFTQEFQRLRARLLALAKKLHEEFQRRKEPEQARVFENAAHEIRQDVTVILLGPFSSGKSTFLNTLLGLTADKHPLPTSGKPETATINILEFAKTEEIQPFFSDVIELELFSSQELESAEDDSEPGPRPGRRWKIHKVEIEALCQWWRQGALDRERIAVERFPLWSKAKQKALPFSAADIANLARLAEESASHCDESLLDQHRLPRILADLRFRRRPALPRGMVEAQAQIKQPWIALQLDHALFKRNIEVLRGLRFVDTPGTDSAIAYHHTLARKFIDRHRDAPILYCFDGTRAGSNEDRKNVEFLASLAGELDRVFFIITKRRGARNQEEMDEVRGKVRDLLRHLRFPAARVFFIDSIEARGNPDEPEWKGLITQLKDFVDRNRTALLRQRGEGLIRDVLEGLRAETKKQIERLKNASQRAAEIQRITAELDAIAVIARNFPLHAEKAAERLFRAKGSGNFSSDFDRAIQALSGFDCGAYRTVTLNSKLAQIQEILKPLDPWPGRLRDNLEEASRILHQALKDGLGKTSPEEAGKLKVLPLRPDLSLLELADARAVAQEGIARRLVTSYRGDLQRKVDRIGELLRNKKKPAETAALAAFATIEAHYTGLYKAREERLRKTLEELKNADERDRKKAIAANQARLTLIERYLKEYRAI